MAVLGVVLCAAVAGFLWPQGVSTASQRLVSQLPKASPKHQSLGEPGHGRRSGEHERTAGQGDQAARGRWGLDSRRDDRTVAACCRTETGRRDLLMRCVAAGAAGVLCVVMLGGLFGLVVGVLAGLAVWHSFSRLGNAERKREQARLV